MFCFSNFNYWCPLNIKRQPAIERLTDYYPFGMTEPGRSWNSSDYRFGYTGHEKESDLAEGVYTTEYRLLDTRLGRWMSVDPLAGDFAWVSPYNYCDGNPVVMVDPDGEKFVNGLPQTYQTQTHTPEEMQKFPDWSVDKISEGECNLNCVKTK